MKLCGNCNQKETCNKFKYYGSMSNYAERCQLYEEALKPCPFCGQKAKITVWSSNGKVRMNQVISCEKCGISIRHKNQDIVSIWNQRTTER